MENEFTTIQITKLQRTKLEGLKVHPNQPTHEIIEELLTCT